MFQLADGREQLYQWDIDRRIRISDPLVTEVHYCNRTDDCALVVKTYTDDTYDGQLYAEIPNILLQDNFPIRVYAYANDKYTKECKVFKVTPRSKPADYVYTETEIMQYSSVDARMTALEDSIGTLVADEVSDYMEENPIQVDLSNYYNKPETEALVDEALENVDILKGTASGNRFILTDVSAIEHEVTCKLESKNILDITSVIGQTKTSGTGALKVGEDGGFTGSGTPTDYLGFAFKPILPVDTYTFTSYGEYTNITAVISVLDASGTKIIQFTIKKEGTIVNLADYPTYKSLLIEVKRVNSKVEMSGTIYVQAEKGSLSTSYATPVNVANKTIAVNEVAYIANANGEITGIPSSSTMSFIAPEGILINASYNRDITKAVEDISNSISANKDAFYLDFSSSRKNDPLPASNEMISFVTRYLSNKDVCAHIKCGSLASTQDWTPATVQGTSATEGITFIPCGISPQIAKTQQTLKYPVFVVKQTEDTEWVYYYSNSHNFTLATTAYVDEAISDIGAGGGSGDDIITLLIEGSQLSEASNDTKAAINEMLAYYRDNGASAVAAKYKVIFATSTASIGSDKYIGTIFNFQANEVYIYAGDLQNILIANTLINSPFICIRFNSDYNVTTFYISHFSTTLYQSGDGWTLITDTYDSNIWNAKEIYVRVRDQSTSYFCFSHLILEDGWNLGDFQGNNVAFTTPAGIDNSTPEWIYDGNSINIYFPEGYSDVLIAYKT